MMMPMTIAEKILARASGRSIVKPGDYVTAKIDKFMSHEYMAAVGMHLEAAGIKCIPHPEKVYIILDHVVPAPNQRMGLAHRLVRESVKKLGITHYYGERAGIAHQVMMEKGNVLPGELIVATDSHTVSYGALNAAATGIGHSEFAYAICTGDLWFRVPETIRFVMSGKLKYPVASKDVILKIAGDYTSAVATYKSVEFTGPAAKAMSIESRMAMSAMSVEIGAKFGLFEFDDKTRDYLKPLTSSDISGVAADENARYEKVYEIDVSSIEPQVALPHTVDNVKPVSKVDKVPIDQAVIGGCGNGRLEDLDVAASIVKGKKIHDRVRMLINPASWDIYQKAIKNGTLSTLVEAGAIILPAGCGPCEGLNPGVLIEGERCISATNRNFVGRMGSDRAEVYLASPATVAASAIRGEITDPREII
jgi:3-isopropylmalate/(R)-2-methylmalate dehydratase large subunit